MTWRCFHCPPHRIGEGIPDDERSALAPKRVAGKLTCCQTCRAEYDAGTHHTQPRHTPYQKSSPTSREGADAGKKSVARQRAIILKALRDNPAGLRRYDLEKQTGIKESTLCARLKPMTDEGLIEVPGKTRGPYGTDVIFYRARNQEAAA